MCDTVNEYALFLVIDGIKHPVVADTEAIALSTLQLSTS
jgi:hypothetical protein